MVNFFIIYFRKYALYDLCGFINYKYESLKGNILLFFINVIYYLFELR